MRHFFVLFMEFTLKNMCKGLSGTVFCFMMEMENHDTRHGTF